VNGAPQPQPRTLIVNADDLGLSDEINRGIVEAVEHGIVTSASLMVRGVAASEAGAWARLTPGVSVGLHLDLGEWVHRGQAWEPRYTVVDTGDAQAVADELARQLGRFLVLVGKPPTHLDSHQHVHRSEPVRSILVEAGRCLRVPVRGYSSITHCGAFHGQSGKGEPHPDGITLPALLRIFDTLPAGVTELGCHPGGDDLDDVPTTYRRERGIERRTLCDARLRDELQDRCIAMATFLELGR
jgi:predicted glycoside hydrolase/deacetylase ChbG (UPF0249 family)